MAIDQRAQNNVYAGAVHTATREDDMAAFDALPPALRWVVNENATKLSSYTVLRYAHALVASGIPTERAVHLTIIKIYELEQGEISVFAGRHVGEFRIPLPHAAAGASVQRYGARRSLPRRSASIRGLKTLHIQETA